MPDYVRGSGKEIPLADYAPDLDPTTPGIILDANNAVPTMKGYMARNAPIQVATSQTPAAFPFPPQGAYIAQFMSLNGQPSLYAAGGGNIYIFEGMSGGWQLVAGPPAAVNSRVRFTQFNDDVIATAAGLGGPLVSSSQLGGFHALGGGPPANAPIVISVGGFVVFFAGASWFSSAAGVDNNYTPNIQTLAATGTLYDVPGDITAAAALYRSIVAFKAGATWVGVFSGSPFTWSFQLISGQVGTFGQECVVTLPDSIAFLGTDDFYITTGYTPQRIPNSLKEWFFATADPSQLANVIGWYDPQHSIIYWHFVSLQTPVSGMLDRYVAYNVRVGRWSTGYLNTNFVVPNTQDSLVALEGTANGSAQAGYFFDPNNLLKTWDGNQGAVPGTMYVKTGYVGDETNLSQLQRFRAKWNTAPTFDFGQAYHTNILGQTPIFDSAVVRANDDWQNCRQYDRWHQVQFNSVGSAEITAYAYQARIGGTR